MEPRAESIDRWVTIWITLGVLIVIVVVGFLIGRASCRERV